MFIFSNWKELLTLQRTHLGPVLHACADPASCLLRVELMTTSCGWSSVRPLRFQPFFFIIVDLAWRVLVRLSQPAYQRNVSLILCD